MSAKRVLIAAVLVASVFPIASVAQAPMDATAPAQAPAGAAACSGCHAAGAGVATPVPRLVGLAAAEIVKAMQEFRAGTRAATVMDRIARGYTEDEIQAIAAWYARLR